MRIRQLTVIVALALLGALLVPATGSAQPTNQTLLPSPVPSTTTPNVTDGTVLAITQVGSRIVLGGSFTSASQQGSSTTVSRSRLLAFDATTGTIDPSFAPVLDNTVQNMTPGPTPDTVYVGGNFSTVNGTKMKGIALLSTVTGQLVSGFKPPALNGVVFGVRLAPDASRLYIGGSFTLTNAVTHDGLATLNPLTGTLDPFMNVQTTGHHNYTGQAGQSNGAVGPRRIDISPDGRTMIAIGNFKYADGLLRDQIVRIDLSGSSAAVDQGWASAAYSAACIAKAYDTYMSDVDFSADGSYFAVGATGGSGKNVDGTNSSCDSVARFETATRGSNVRPTWIDYTGRDTIGSVAVAGDVIYAGGHQRWLNNENGSDSPGQGAVPRPGLAALDPLNGVPFSWNPGRDPRGIGAYALLATRDGVYVGSDTDYIGPHKYLRKKVAFFPLSSTAAPANTTATLPSNVYLPGALSGASYSDTLQDRSFTGSTAGTTSTVPSSFSWSSVRGAFLVDNTLFYGKSDGTFDERSFDGTTLGAEVSIDPYDDPTWSNVDTGSGQTYRGKKPDLYGQMSTVTGMFYNAGFLYYTLAGKTTLFARYFTPESGIIGPHVFTFAGGNLSSISGMFYTGGSIYYAATSNGSLHRVPFDGTTLAGGSDTVVNGPSTGGPDWRARGLFLSSGPTAPANQPPTASVTTSCTDLTCTIDGSASRDTDGQITTYAFDFGDNQSSTGSDSAVQHTYTQAGTYTVRLQVTDNDGASDSTTTTVQVSPSTPPPTDISFVGSSSQDLNGSSRTVQVPAGVHAGDGLVLLSSTNTSTSPADPAGWSRVSTLTNTMTTTVWQRVASAADAGSSVKVTASGVSGGSLVLLAYRGTNGTSPVAQAVPMADASPSASHTTPTVSSLPSGSWVISYWADKSSTTTAWTPPPGPAARETDYGTGAGRICSLTMDAGPVSGSYGGLTATTDTAGAKAEQWTIVLATS